MVRDELSVLAAFVAVAEERSFTKAAKRLGVSPSALSHALRGLEERIGVRLLARTTRSVAPTDAGEQLLTRVRPAFGDIREAVDQLSGLRERPAGRVRLLLPRSAAMIALVPKLAQLTREYPDVVLEVTTDNRRVDLVAAGFDAGIQIDEFIQMAGHPAARSGGTGRSNIYRVKVEARRFCARLEPVSASRKHGQTWVALAIGSTCDRCRANRDAGDNQLHAPILLSSGWSIVRRDRLRLAEARGCHRRRRDALRDEVRAH
jgi:DNA-binding transcriptional LysR family regulator